MATSFTSTSASVIDQIYNSSILEQIMFDGTNYANVMRQPEIESWKPIIYTSMEWFMFWNYVLLALMIILPSVIIYGLVTL